MQSLRSQTSQPCGAFLFALAVGFGSGIVMTKVWGEMKRKLQGGGKASLWNKEEMVNDVPATQKEPILMDSPQLDHRILRKAEYILQCRTSQILVVVERCTNDHNYSAILRTCEALGVQHVYLISPKKPEKHMIAGNDDDFVTHVSEETNVEGNDDNDVVEEDDVQDVEDTSKVRLRSNQKAKPKMISSSGRVVKNANTDDFQSRRMHHLYAQGATKWLSVKEFDSTESCIETLREEGRTIWATDLGQDAVCLTREELLLANELDKQRGASTANDGSTIIPTKLAIVFGTEAVGCTKLILEAAHRRVYLPMYGFADSLNLSVATALCLQQLFSLCPTAIGCMDETERSILREEWFTKLACRRITTTGERKRLARLTSQIEKTRELERQAAEMGLESLHQQQIDKLEKLEGYIDEYESCEATIYERARLAVQGFIKDPPRPISDVRRPDSHRVCFVGSGTKKKYETLWKDMAAVKNEGEVIRSTAEDFRDLLKAAQEG